MLAANGTQISTYGSGSTFIRLCNNISLKVTFILADVNMIILGNDFFRSHRLANDVTGKRLLNTDNFNTQDLLPIQYLL